MTGELFDALADAERQIPSRRPCVHCFRPTPARGHVRRVVCAGCQDIEAALNGPVRPDVQPAALARPPGVQPWWTPAEDRILAGCATAAEAAARLPWRTKVSCSYRLKTLRRAGKLAAFDHRQWTPAEDRIVAALRCGAAIRWAAAGLGRTVVAVHRRRGELRRAGWRVTRLRGPFRIVR